MAASNLDLAILEVGLGGRLDAVNIIDADCAVITSIDLDHMDYLGPDRESIGREKAGILRTGRPAIVSDPVPPQSVLDRAAAIGADLWRWGATSISRATSSSGPGPGAAGATRAWPIRRCAAPTSSSTPRACWPRWRRCGQRLPVTAQAVRNGLAHGGTAGALPDRARASRRWCWTSRTTRIRSRRWRPTSTRWASIRPRMRVFGAMADKDLAPMLREGRAAGRPLVLHRPADAARRRGRAACWRDGRRRTRARDVSGEHPCRPHGGPARRQWPLQTPLIEFVVFGSFYTVGGVLKDGLPRLQAKHLG